MSAAIELVATEFVLLAIGCFFLLRYYAASMVSTDVFVAVYLSWVLGFASVLFLPYDLSVTLVENEKSIILERVWKFVYWSTFILAWAVLPIQMEYHGSGHFSFKEKMWDSVYNLIFSGILAVLAGVIYIIYLVSTSGGTFSQVIGFVMAMGNTYGVLLITLLMGNGLVALPMHLWRLGDIERGLRELYLSAAYVEESFQDARYELEDCEAEVQNIVGLLDKSGSAALRSEVRPFVDILRDKVANFQFVKRSKSRAYVRGFQFDKVEDSVLTTKKHLIKLHARLMTAQLKARASERRWNVLISECERQQEISSMRESNQGLVDAMRAGTGPSSTSGGASSPSANPNPSLLFILCNPWTWRTPDFLRPYCEGLYVLWAQQLYVHSCRGAAVVCGLMSVLILWSEMLMSSQMHSPIGLMMTAYDYQTSSSVMVQGVSFVALMYMSMCTYWPLFRINIGWTYKLQGPQQSSPFSLIFNAEYLSRLQFTIGYNFLMYLNVPKTSNTAFNQLMQNIDLIPVFGTSFAVYIPLIMLIVALLTLFDGFGRIVKVLGIEWEDASSDSHNGLSCTCRNRDQEIALDPQLQEKIRTGKLIVSNEVKQRRANDLMSDSRSGRTANGSNNDLSHTKPHMMRIGAPTNSTLMTEALISSNATYNPTYRNIVASADIENDQDLDLDLSDHQLSYGGGGPSRGGYSRPGSDRGLELGRNGGLSAAEAAAKNSLFGFSGSSTNSRQGTSPNASSGNRRAGTDLFSISNDEAVNPYAGRYSDV